MKSKKIVLASIVLAALTGLGASAMPQGRTLYVSFTRKGEVAKYLDRLPTPEGQIVVTLQPVSRALRQRAILIPPGHTPFLAELRQADLPALPGERFRDGLRALVSFATNDPAFERLHHSGAVNLRPVPFQESTYPRFVPTQGFRPLSAPALRNVAIDPAYLKEKLAQFSGAAPVEIGGHSTTITERGSPAGRDLARAFLKQEYERLGFSVSFHKYSATGINFVAEKKGADPVHFYIVSSHIDSVSNPGADDDGSGTVSALAAAKALSGAKLKTSLRIVGFDQEEKGLVGSEAYAKELVRTGEMANLQGVFHFEMNGYHKRNDGGFHVIDCNENTSAQLTAMIMQAIASRGIPLKRVEACTSASDHSVFWKYNKPSIVTSENFFGHDSNPCYHKACDKIDILNFPYMAGITTANTIALAGALGAE